MRTVSKSNITVKDLRERAGLTQRKVSVALDIRTATVSDWERGIVEPRLPFEKVRTLLNLYGCTFDELADAFEVVKESKVDIEVATNTAEKMPVAA
jgi:transcriptional regulator with XRE-family HTH domain